MHTIKYFFVFLFLAYFFAPNLIALQREYETEDYCGLHQRFSNKPSLVKEYISLIPSSSEEKCSHVECPQCHDVWIEYYLHDNYDDEDEEEWTEIYWNCHCKDKILKKNYKKYWDYWMPKWIKCNNRPI